MGDPKKLRKKYSKPNHPWQKLRIDEEKILTREYGLKNKKELWKMVSRLKAYKQRVKKLIQRKDKQAEIEKEQLMKKVQSLNLVKTDAKIEDILGISVREISERRLQTRVYKKGFAKTIKQARQYVTHEHVLVGDKMINSPSYLVSLEEESSIKVTGHLFNIPETPEKKTPEADK
ncbi:30S ribosomal protein S4 [Candidatus Woesearchaeota archaeon]|nr:30S ribosomal protein S4 [Candidatus Woesearchaeota archaeon]